MTKAFLLSRWAAIGTELARGQAGENLVAAATFLRCDISEPSTAAGWWRLWLTSDPDGFAEALLAAHALGSDRSRPAE